MAKKQPKKRAAKKAAPKKKAASRESKPESSWRRIQQSPTEADSDAARARRWKIRLRMLAALCIIGLVAGGSVGVVWLVKEYDLGTYFASRPEPLREITFETDGFLTREWLAAFSPVEGETDQRDINIFDLKNTLESQGQVLSATVERVLPDGLRIVLQEHKPSLRLKITGADGDPAVLLVSSTGHVYSGFGYPRDILERLPFLTGKPLVASSGSEQWEPIVEAQEVSALCQLASRQYPHLYKNWRYISCAEYNGRANEPGAVIRVVTKEGYEIFFPPTDFGERLRQLSIVEQKSLEEGKRPLAYIDLTADHQVAVKEAQTGSRHPVR